MGCTDLTEAERLIENKERERRKRRSALRDAFGPVELVPGLTCDDLFLVFNTEAWLRDEDIERLELVLAKIKGRQSHLKFQKSLQAQKGLKKVLEGSPTTPKKIRAH